MIEYSTMHDMTKKPSEEYLIVKDQWRFDYFDDLHDKACMIDQVQAIQLGYTDNNL